MSSELHGKVANRLLLDKLTSDNIEQVKSAAAGVDAYTRLKVREKGFARKILPAIPITNEDLDPQMNTDLNVKLYEMETDSPGAMTVPYGGLPMNRYIRAARYPVFMARLQTPRFTKDVGELRSLEMDIRQILSDNAIDDMLAEEDGGLLAAANSIMIGPNQIVPETGVAHWQEMSGGITRDNLNEALKVMPRSSRKFEAQTMLVNTIFVKDIQKFQRLEAGGDFSEKLLMEGWSEDKMLGRTWLTTIKRELVGDNTIYMFAEPKALGKFCVLEDVTMYLDRKAFMIEFFAYSEVGAAIANVGAVGRVDFLGTSA
jgi:hypothetical protein